METKINFLKFLFKFFFTVIVLVIVTFIGLKITKMLLYHPYTVKKFGTFDGNKDFIVIFHGVYGKSETLEPIAKELENRGYSGINIQYPTTDGTIEKLSEKYIIPNIEFISQTVKKSNIERKKKGLPEIKINFITHSMGTGILRYYLKTHKLDNSGKVIFLSPPAHGSELSDNPVADALKSTLGESVAQLKTSDNSFINSLGEPDYPCYVMIGNKSSNFLYSLIIPGVDDGMVPFKTSRLNNCKYRVIENATHTSILKDKRTIDEIIKYLGSQ